MSQKGQAGSVNDDNDDEPVRTRTASQPQQQQQIQQSRQQNGTSNQIQNPGNNPQQAQVIKQIEELKRIRADLRDKLHNYQSDFFKNHNRRIRYHKDIQPVENEYRQYKETKLELIRLESLLQKQ